MDIKEFINKYYPDGFYTDEKMLVGRKEEINRRNSVYLVNDIPVNILFIGDSIIDWWEINAYFSKFGALVNRGIGGETTTELTKRFSSDALDLKPKICVILEGINDLYELKLKDNNGNLSDNDKTKKILALKENYLKLIDMSAKAKQALIFCSILPLGVADFRNELIIEINKMLKDLCNEYKICYADFHSKLTQPDGLTLKNVTFGDDLHPHVVGYNIMAEVLTPIIEKML